MRPPQNAGEDEVRRLRNTPANLGFNEAPAERGGRRDRRDAEAIMRGALQ